MEEGFELPVVYKGEELEFSAKLVISGYTYKFIVMIDNKELTFEKDDEGNYRAVNYTPDLLVQTDIYLLEAIVHSLKQISE